MNVPSMPAWSMSKSGRGNFISIQLEEKKQNKASPGPGTYEDVIIPKQKSSKWS